MHEFQVEKSTCQDTLYANLGNPFYIKIILSGMSLEKPPSPIPISSYACDSYSLLKMYVTFNEILQTIALVAYPYLCNSHSFIQHKNIRMKRVYVPPSFYAIIHTLPEVIK